MGAGASLNLSRVWVRLWNFSWFPFAYNRSVDKSGRTGTFDGNSVGSWTEDVSGRRRRIPTGRRGARCGTRRSRRGVNDIPHCGDPPLPKGSRRSRLEQFRHAPAIRATVVSCFTVCSRFGGCLRGAVASLSHSAELTLAPFDRATNGRHDLIGYECRRTSIVQGGPL